MAKNKQKVSTSLETTTKKLDLSDQRKVERFVASTFDDARQSLKKIRKAHPERKDIFEDTEMVEPHYSRRIKAAVNYLPVLMKRFEKYRNLEPDDYALFISQPTCSIASLDIRGSLCTGAALWILDTLKDCRKMQKLYENIPWLPDDAPTDMPTIYDPCHSYENMPDREWHHYRVNERVNDRGVKIDTELVQQAIACDLMLSDAMTKKAYELTGLENPNSVSQLKSWLDERGIPMDSLGKKDVAQMIGELDKNGVDEEAMDMLKLRLQMAKSSVKKYQAAERCVCPDGRARGLFQFYGASRTGRYSGRNIQLQNLPQNHISTLEQARDLVKMGCFDMVESIYGNTPDVLSQLIRTMLVPKEGCEFIVADFSAIEARVLA